MIDKRSLNARAFFKQLSCYFLQISEFPFKKRFIKHFVSRLMKSKIELSKDKNFRKA